MEAEGRRYMDLRHLGVRLDTVDQQWRDLPPDQRPQGVWICYHEPLPPEAVDRITTPLREVWFLDAQGLRSGDPWAFLRFFTVHNLRPWNARTVPVKYQIFARAHEIGIAAFASYDGTKDVYLETVWGTF